MATEIAHMWRSGGGTSNRDPSTSFWEMQTWHVLQLRLWRQLANLIIFARTQNACIPYRTSNATEETVGDILPSAEKSVSESFL